MSRFPKLTRLDILACQFSSWYPTFKDITIRGSVIRPLGKEFKEWLEVDGIVIPAGAEDDHASRVDAVLKEDESDEEETKLYSFPTLDAQIREIVSNYGAVFPKLNFTSPKDASWILTLSQPLRCTSPSDIYLFLKSSDFVMHDVDEDRVFEGCVSDGEEGPPTYELELVLKKWYNIERNREMRCFVRDDRLIGLSQRDTNYYPHLTSPGTQSQIRTTILQFFNTNIKGKFGGGPHYTFDVLLTRSLTSAHLIDFNPYAPRTDPLLFTYDSLLSLSPSSHTSSSEEEFPELRVIDSPSHPSASRASPLYSHNMVPKELIDMSAGVGLEGFEGALKRAIEEQAMEGESEDEG